MGLASDSGPRGPGDYTPVRNDEYEPPNPHWPANPGDPHMSFDPPELPDPWEGFTARAAVRPSTLNP